MFGRVVSRVAVGYAVLAAGQVLALGVTLLILGRDRIPSDVLTLQLLGVASVGTIGVVLALGLGIWLARPIARHLEALSRALQRVGRGELDQRVSTTHRDEIGALASSFNEMTVELRRTISALEQERREHQAVLSHMADGLVIVDSSGTVRFVNPAAVDLLGISPGWAEGRPVMAVVRDHELGALVRSVMDTPRAPAGRDSKGGAFDGRRGPPQEASARLVALGSGAQRRSVQALASRIPRSDGGGNVMLVLQDVTEVRRTESVRREFVANVSHELRTPVAALKALVETLEAGALDDPSAARDFVSRMHVEVDGLAQLVEELLELSRVESGQVALELAPTDIGPVVTSAAERLRPQADRQGINLVVEVPSLPPVQADAVRLQQVVTNLVHNAIKFTPPGGSITVGGERLGDDVQITVADTGIGIAPESLPRLFERFYKAERARASGGTGLGLAIAKHVVQAHGGRIWATSRGEGLGAVFTFSLPAAAQSSSQA